MIISARVRLPLLAGIAALALTACASGRPASDRHTAPGDHSATPPAQSRGKTAWSMKLPAVESESTSILAEAAQSGGNVVVSGSNAAYSIDARTGKKLWKVTDPSGQDVYLRVIGNIVVLDSTDDFLMVDATSGKRLWTWKYDLSNPHPHGPSVTRNSMFTIDCERHGKRCTVARHDLRTGKVRWRFPAGGNADLGYSQLSGVGPLKVRPTGRYVAVDLKSSREWQVRSTATGKPTRAHAADRGAGDALISGRNLIVIDDDPPANDKRCTVRVLAKDAVTGERRWTRTVFSARKQDHECAGELPRIGASTRVAASTADNRPQLFDLATGRTIWQGRTQGVPIDSDGNGMLVRDRSDSGKLHMLDFATGRVRWTAPDPRDDILKTEVNSRLVAATNGSDLDNQHVLVYDSKTGRNLGRFAGTLVGLGDDWVLVVTGDDFDARFSLIRF